jgi:hypothetical protein
LKLIAVDIAVNLITKIILATVFGCQLIMFIQEVPNGKKKKIVV